MPKIFHSTSWESLESMLVSEVIAPRPISTSDCKNPVLADIARLGIECAWFSTQAWSSNRFGAYVFEFDTDDLVLPEIVELGKHNNARCYLSLPSALSVWVARKIGRPTIRISDDASWRPANRDDRVDFLIGWKVPISTEILFTSTTNIQNHRVEGDANFAKARFAAKMLLEKNSRFNTALEPVTDSASNLLRWMIGIGSAFDKARKEVDPSHSFGKPACLEAALTSITQSEIQLATLCAAHIGEISDVTNELVSLLNNQFPDAKLEAHAVEAAV
jgi:hypothetical protein